MTKKLFPLFSVLLVAVMLLAACGPKEAGPVTINLWTKEGEADGGLQYVQALADAYTAAHPNVTFVVTNKEVETLREDFQTASLANAAPELLWTVSDHLGPFTTADLIQPVDKLVDLGKYVGSATDAVKTPDGKTWGVPIANGNHLMLLYNKKLIAAPPKNTNDMIKVAKELTRDLNKDGMPDQYGLVYNLNEPFFFAPWLGGFGGWPLDGTKPTLNTQAMIDALQFVQDLKFVHKIVPLECDYDAADSLFKEGKAAMLINGDWSLAGYQTDDVKKKVDLGVARIPMVSKTGRWPSPMTSGIYFMLPEYLEGDKLQIAKEFVQYCSSPDVQLMFLNKYKRLPALASALDSPLIKADPVLSGSADQMVVGKPMPTVPEMRAAWDAIRPNQEAVMAGKMAPKDAAKAMQDACEKLIREMTK